MQSLTHQRCFNHSNREAAARCPECANFFCRECITEHDDRVVCAACLKKLAKVPLTQRSAFVGVVRTVQLLAGLVVLVLFFYVVGQCLLAMPSSLHDGTVWKPDFLSSE